MTELTPEERALDEARREIMNHMKQYRAEGHEREIACIHNSTWTDALIAAARAAGRAEEQQAHDVTEGLGVAVTHNLKLDYAAAMTELREAGKALEALYEYAAGLDTYLAVHGQLSAHAEEVGQQTRKALARPLMQESMKSDV